MFTEWSLVNEAISYPHDREWTLQGFGMLRTYLDPEKTLRLHIWDDLFANEGVSEMHTHPWDFISYVIAGEVDNIRYSRDEAQGKPWWCQDIHCGMGGGLKGEPYTVLLRQEEVETYVAGDSYSQLAQEIHVSRPLRGTITVIRRTFGEDVDTAQVFWPQGGTWVTAEPRVATDAEVDAVLSRSDRLWGSPKERRWH